MGKKILIVDAGCTNYGKGGTLSHAFAALAKETLEGLGHTVDVTTVDREFDPQAEAEKIAAADSVIFQVPGWWMYIPWQLRSIRTSSSRIPSFAAETGGIATILKRSTVRAAS